MMPTRFISCVYCISVWNYCSNPDLYLPGFWVSGHNSCTCFLFDLGMDLPHLFHHIFFLRVMNLVLSKRWSAINPICRQEPGSERWRPAFEGIYPDTQARYPSGQVIAARTAQRCLKGVRVHCVLHRAGHMQQLASWFERHPQQQEVASVCVLKSL